MAENRIQATGSWELAEVQLLGQAMSAREILAAIFVRPERLPSGLGILAVSAPLERRDDLMKLRMVDTLVTEEVHP